MQDLQGFFSSQQEKHQQELQQVKKKLGLLATLRLSVFVALALGIYFLWGTTAIFVLLPLGIVLFLFLVTRFSNVKRHKEYLQRLIVINGTELDILSRKFHHLPDGKEFLKPDHPYAQDLDVFGRGSFYQYTNRTTLVQGSEVFANLLLDGYPKDIAKKQAAIQELAQLPEWRQHFSALAGETEPKISPDVVSYWMKNHKSFIPKWGGMVPVIFASLSLILIAMAFWGWVPESLILFWYFLGVGAVGRYAKKILAFTAKVSEAQDTIQQHQRLISELEEHTFNSELLQELQKKLVVEGERTSKILKRFSQSMTMLEQQFNLVISMFAQGLGLYSVYYAFQIESWIGKHGQDVEGWFAAIAQFDAYITLGTYAFNHPEHTYPNLVGGNIVMQGKDIGHPLVDSRKNILNDFEIEKGRFCIVTGANMAGKSTFLRAVGLQIVMANMGLPIMGKEVLYNPVRLLTSMRSSDSLADETSYFYAELKRLKYIVEELEKDDCFVILDEILKGTNSVDKAEGSKKFVERLVRNGSTGMVATHDLSLCTLADELPEVENRYFDAQILDGELYFDYKFKEGVCQNMNASFLLRKMDIIKD
ncbi:DNA mismatch repair protein MutS [Muricauda oceani]|uniref:DNA mismatch repair protein MutS n=1 Tax=Flagellimonas oceani TaxID=2698672 RepID=A0A6G7J7R1_9FLAO|nr:DNA mismatch repair protein MutS [Allomuricauda oceani]MBW8241953.1 DNA mismatch repair protein MutS [Allomuricauda oceani]QII46865.1 DNA mismatch repair protein MutS [Allomuricauda oceani]